MASRKEQKEQARATRLAQEQAAAATAQRTRRIQILGGAIAIAVIAIVVVIVLSISGSGGNSGSALTQSSAAKASAKLVANELAGIPQSGATLGNPNAKVTLTYFGDLQCPVCMAFTTGQSGGGLPEFIANQVKPGNVKIVYRSFCTASCNNTSVSNPQGLFATQQEAAYAAGKQGKFWNYAELFYHEQGKELTPYVTPAYLAGIAKQIPGLNISTWQADRTQATYAAQVSSDSKLASKYGVSATPAFVVQGPKGIQSAGSGVLTYSDLMKAVSTVS